MTLNIEAGAIFAPAFFLQSVFPFCSGGGPDGAVIRARSLSAVIKKSRGEPAARSSVFVADCFDAYSSTIETTTLVPEAIEPSSAVNSVELTAN